MKKRITIWGVFAVGLFVTALWWCVNLTTDSHRLTQIGADAGFVREIREIRERNAKEKIGVHPSSVVKKSSTPTKCSSLLVDPSSLDYTLPVGVRLDRDMDFGTPQFVGDWNRLLSRPAPGAKVEEILEKFIEANSKAFTLIPSDVLEHGVVWRDYESGGIRHVTWQQEHEGLDVFGARFAMHLTEKNELINVSSRALHFPSLLFHDEVKTTRADVEERFASLESLEPVWYPLDMMSCVKSWQVVAGKGMDYKLSVVRADTGEVAYEKPLVWAASEVSLNVFVDDSPLPMTPGPNAPTNFVPAAAARQMVNGEWGIGNELRGNNAFVYADRDDDDAPDGPVLTSGDGVFDLPVDLTQGPETYEKFSQVQAFYWANFFHDRTYALGFDEVSGNFQIDNFGNGGVGGDALTVEVQNGGDLGFSYVNQGWYSGFGDGHPNCKVVVSVFSRTQPHRCGALDGQVMLHEMTHGMSARLVGNGFGLSKTQSRGMAEGWSDFFALALLSKDTDALDGCYPMMNYAGQYDYNSPQHYFGIRRFPYSTDSSKAPQTLADADPNQLYFPSEIPRSRYFGSKDADQIHNLGEIWCLALWQGRANLIKTHGFSGNELMMQLVVEGLKLSPEDPTFTQARDAILQADLVLNGGANQVDLWSGFATRGLGYGAVVPEVWTTVGIAESFELPFIIETEMTEHVGDGDGFVEPGERGDLLVSISSPGLSLSNMTAMLTAVSSNVTATLASSVLNDIPAGGSEDVTFRFDVNIAFPGFTDAVFVLQVVTDKGAFEKPLRLRIGNPNDYPPEILAIDVADVTENEATISWNTGLPSTGLLRYGLTTNYTDTVTLDTTFRTNHVVQLSGLQKGTDYHFQLVANGDNGLVRNSEDEPFTTRARIYVYADSNATDELGTIGAPFKTLQDAADASGSSGNEIMVAEGVYTGSHKEGVLYLDGTEYDLSISGGWSPDFTELDHKKYVCTIDGEQQHRGIALDNGAALVLSGFIISNGSSEWGGGINVRKSKASLLYSIIEHSSSHGHVNDLGGGAYATLGGELRLFEVFIRESTSSKGGAICAVSSTTQVICDRGCISKNASTLTGGGIIAQLGASVHASSSLIYDNASLYPGGGISVLPFSEVKCEKSIVSMNRSTLADYVEFRGGGGIYVAGSVSTGRVELVNSIVWGNDAYQGADILAEDMAECIAEYSLIGDIMGRLSSSNHVLQVDPFFFDPQSGDFHIVYGSPCIDAGSPDYRDGGIDMDGENRVFNGRIDIGADEFVSADADQIADVWELQHFGDLSRSGNEDDDFDSLNTLGEYMAQSDPFDQDTDKDLLRDGDEVLAGMLPNNPDQDADLMLDGWEFKNNLSPFINDAAFNLDSDCMSNLEEFRADTRPHDASSWLGLTNVTRQWGGTRLDWQGGRDSIQWLESSTNLVEWETVMGCAPPTPESNSVILFGEGRYYRIRAHRDSQ